MPRTDFVQVEWNEDLVDDCRQLIRLAVREDLGRGLDWTTVALIPPEQRGRVAVVARQPGVAAGLKVVDVVIEECQLDAEWLPEMADGSLFSAGDVLGGLRGSVRDLLTAERTVLNLLSRLCGVATLTRRYVDEVRDTAVRIYDTRKTTPGWRRLEKYAVRCGGGWNHRTGLFDAVLIKDNHLAFAGYTRTPSAALDAVRQFLCTTEAHYPGLQNLPVEVEVDTLEQLRDVLPHQPDLVLLDNMTPEMLVEAVRLRNHLAPDTLLEASGGVRLENVRTVAQTGVDRISVGALTHQAVAIDVGFDWQWDG